jgi:phosphohistidine phosphatase
MLNFRKYCSHSDGITKLASPEFFTYMKTLLLARHGTAEERQQGKKDFDRTLIGKGKTEAAFAGERLRKLNVIPDVIISSPAPRAFSTAKIICSKIKFPTENIRTEKILYTGNVSQILALLKKIKSSDNVVMLCGHNPLLEEVFSSLCAGQIKEIHKGDIIGITFNVDDWKNVKSNTGKYSFTITQNKNSKPRDMKNNKSKNKKKELQEQVANLIHTFTKSKIKRDSKKIRKSVKEASKLVAKALLKTLGAEVKTKKKTEKRKTVKKVKGTKAKLVVKKNPVKKPVTPKVITKKLVPSMNNITEKVSIVESNPQQVQ